MSGVEVKPSRSRGGRLKVKATPAPSTAWIDKSRKCRPVPVPKYGYYVYSSAPTQKPRPKYRYNVPKPRGAHDYYNTMWDPHVYRGDTFITFQEVEAERRRIIEAAKDLRKRFKKAPPRRLGGIILPTTPPPSEGHCLVMNLKKFLEEEERVVEEVDAITQTDLFEQHKDKVCLVPAKIGFDVSTETLTEELFNFEEEVRPLLTTLVSKVLEQSLLETCEEEELLLLRDEQQFYEERARLEKLRTHRIAERERKMAAERDRRMKIMEGQAEVEAELEELVGARMFSNSYLKLSMPHVFETLEAVGFLQTVNAAAVTEEFIPWANSEVLNEISQSLLARAMLDDLLESDVKNREVEMAAANAWNQMPEAPDVSDAEIEEEGEYFADGEATTTANSNIPI